MVQTINESNVSELTQDGVTVIDFWAPWCGPCRTLSPIIENIAEKNPDVKVAKVNVEENRDLASQYGIRKIPTLVYLKDSQEIERSSGMQAEQEIQKVITGLK